MNDAAAAHANPALRAELLRRADLDQDARRASPHRPTAEQWAAVEAIDADNTTWMREVIAASGWPGASQVGADGAHAAWLLIQHASLDLQRQCLPLLASAVATADATIQQFAWLLDRIRMRLDLPQVFGSQFQMIGDDLTSYQIEDPEHVDERRAAIGVGTVADQAERIRGDSDP
jgi:hypothetical protein